MYHSSMLYLLVGLTDGRGSDNVQPSQLTAHDDSLVEEALEIIESLGGLGHVEDSRKMAQNSRT